MIIAIFSNCSWNSGTPKRAAEDRLQPVIENT